MVVSSAFAELAEILACLDRSGVTTENISVVEESVQGKNEITADVTVAVSLFDEMEFADGVSVTNGDADLLEEDVTVDLTITVPDSVDRRDLVRSSTSEATTPTIASPETDTPAYKHPETLEKVYERYDSFPQMTEALDVDVTPETVRRHMIKYGIHDAGDSAEADVDEAAEADADEPAETDDGQAAESTDRPTAEPRDRSTAERSDGSAAKPASETAVERSTASAGDGESSPETAGDDTDEPRSDDGDDQDRNPNLSDRYVADLLTGDSEAADGRAVADGNGIPKDLTVGQLAAALEESRTVYEVTQCIDASYETARGLLEDLDLLVFVKGRLAGADAGPVTPDDVCRRMGVDAVTS